MEVAIFIGSKSDYDVVGEALDILKEFGVSTGLSTVQMPKGVPVATMAVGKTGAPNAALLAVEILSLGDSRLRKKLKEYRLNLAAQVEEASKKVQRKT